MPHISSGVADHFQSPRNATPLPHPTVVGTSDLNGAAPRVAIELEVARDVVKKTAFRAFGCGHLIACCSALTELSIGPLGECSRITAQDVIAALNGLPDNKLFCADLAVAALQDALKKLEGDGP